MNTSTSVTLAMAMFKVGRSISPKSRIASHADRVACVGIELVEHHIAECAGHSVSAEAALIEYCAEAAIKRNRSEWFEGLEYVDVCVNADAIAEIEYEFPANSARCIEAKKILDKAIQAEGSVTALAKRLGIVQNAISNWRARGVPKSWVMFLEERYGDTTILRQPAEAEKAAA